MKKIIHLVGGARPNFMKIAPLFHELKRRGQHEIRLIHTGQHYDQKMSANFFDDFHLPNPDSNLDVGPGTHAEQSGRIMMAYENICQTEKPDLVIVVGDTNSAMAACIAAKKINLAVAHLESGLRSFDREMPEEINRIIVDSISDFLWAPSPDAVVNLKNEGIISDSIKEVGNIMIDAYVMLEEAVSRKTLLELDCDENDYGVVTIHRASNVDNSNVLSTIVESIISASLNIKLYFPIHPRTKKQLEKYNLLDKLLQAKGLKIIEPLGYIEFMALVKNSIVVVTDSGGVQEETTYLGISCLTLRGNTERPITVTHGTNRLIKAHELNAAILEVIQSKTLRKSTIPLWDGKASERIADHIDEILES